MAVFLAGVGLVLLGQAPASIAAGVADKNSSAPAIESSVDLIVRDRHGRVIRNLEPGDLHLTEDGQPVAIHKLEVRKLSDAVGLSPDAQTKYISLVIDESENSAEQVPRDAMQQMMKQLGEANVYFSVWSVRDRVALQQPFTRDQEALLEGVEAARKGRRGKTQALPASQMSADTRAIEQATWKRATEMVRDQHSRPSAALLFALAQEQANLPGRKTVLYVSDGQQINDLTADDLLAITGIANRSHVSVYAIDTSGVSQGTLNAAANLYRDSMMMGAMLDQTTNGRGYYKGQPGATSMYSGTTQVYNVKNQGGNNQLRKLALETGGTYIDGSSSRGPLQKVAEDVATYYEVTYSPANRKYDGHFCPMNITIDRSHVQTQARSGYFSSPPFGLRDVSPFELPLLNALTGSERQETIWFRCAVVPPTTGQQGQASTLRVTVPVNGLVAREDDTTKRFHLHVAMLALLRGDDGSALKKLSRDVILEGPLESLQQARKQVYKFQEPFQISATKYRIDIAIQDQNAGKLSTKTIDSTKPELDEADWNEPAEEQPEGNPEAASVTRQQQPVVKLEEKEGFEDSEPSIHLIASPQLIPNAIRPSDERLNSILDGARQRISDYKRHLPNFVCLMTTKRFGDPSGKGIWKLADSYTSALRYNGEDETTTLLDVNGKRVRRGDQNGFDGASVRGEFGETLSMIFSDRAHAQIEWVGMAQVLGARTHVFRCTVHARNSEYRVVANRSLSLHAAYHAFVYVDSDSLSVRRLTVAADDIPSTFPIKESGLSIDYDYIPIAGQEYLLPVQATLFVRIGRRDFRKNEISFQKYRKYTAQSRMRFDSGKSQ